MDPVQHFELPYRSRERAKRFYFDAFNWQLFDVPGGGYVFATTVPTEANGMPKKAGAINGGLTPRSAQVPGPTILVKVADLKAHLERIRAAGGAVLAEPEAMGPVVLARVRDTEGNVIGVFEDAPKDARAGQEAKGTPRKAAAAKKAGGRKPAKKAAPPRKRR
jgi:predicted enzyme related to lactoylglutathione lyase